MTSESDAYAWAADLPRDAAEAAADAIPPAVERQPARQNGHTAPPT